MTLRRAMFAVAVFALAGIGFTAAACGGDDNTASSESNASQASVEDLSARLQRNEEMFAVVNLSALPLHAMDESLAAGTVETTFVPTARAAIRLFALTNWDSSLQEEATTLQGHATDLLKALENDDVEAAKDPAHELHEGAHDFSDQVWGILAKDLPADAGGVPAHEEEAGDETPAAGATESH